MTTQGTTPQVADAQATEAFASRLFEASAAALEVATIYIGDRLGLYRSLVQDGPATAPELAGRTANNERYIREWLEQQAASGILAVDDASAPPATRRYALPPAYAGVLTDTKDVAHTMPLVRQVLGTVLKTAEVAQAFRTGAGIAWSDYGPDVVEAQIDLNRPHFEAYMADWFAAVPDVHARLQQPGARVADIGAGGAWSSIAIARAYPHAVVDAFDLDERSVELARENIRAAGLEDRVTAHVRDVSDPSLAGRYDLVAAFECIHDFSRPVEALRVMRNMLADGGTVIIMDEAVGESFEAPAGDVDRFFYGVSVLLCLPNSLVDSPSAATGTVMRPAKLAEYASEAGFARTESLPIEHPLWRFYRLHP